MFGRKRYQREVERVCSKYDLPKAIKHYFESLPKPNNLSDRAVRVEVLSRLYSEGELSNAIKCLDEIMKIK